MRHVKNALSVLGTAILCSLLLAIIGIAVLFLTMKIGARIIFVMDGAFIAFLIIRAVIKRIRKSAA